MRFVFVLFLARVSLLRRSHYRIGNKANVLGGIGSALVFLFSLVRLLSAGGGRVVVHLCREENRK